MILCVATPAAALGRRWRRRRNRGGGDWRHPASAARGAVLGASGACVLSREGWRDGGGGRRRRAADQQQARGVEPHWHAVSARFMRALLVCLWRVACVGAVSHDDRRVGFGEYRRVLYHLKR